FAIARCETERPPLISVSPGHASECWRAQELYASSVRVPTRSGADDPATEAASKIGQSSATGVRPGTAGHDGPPSGNGVLLEVDDLHVTFPVKRGPLLRREALLLKAVDGVSFGIRESETFSIVGESGCGKTTTARAVLKVELPTGGRIRWQGQDLDELSEQD